MMARYVSLFALLSAPLLITAQNQCRDECPVDPCASNPPCPRYFNADCITNCKECTANFIFRGRNITDRCEALTCDTRDCGTIRQCMEEVTPAFCESQDTCRQRLRTRCIRINTTRPMTCEDIVCGEGMMCRFRERVSRPPVVRCVPLPPTLPPTTTQQTTSE